MFYAFSPLHGQILTKIDTARMFTILLYLGRFQSYAYPMKYLWFIALLLILQVHLIGQIKSIGVPEIRNIPRNEYGGDGQSWDIIEDKQGNLYLGNNAGVLKFNGENWSLFPVNNKSIVRSLASGSEGRIYVGAYNEIGVLEKSDRHGLQYRSLNHLIPEQARNFDDVWKIHQTRFGVIFQSFEYIFIYSNDTIEVLKPQERFGYSYYLDGTFYVVDKGIGLRVLTGNSLQTISDDPVFSSDEIHSLASFGSNDLLIGTLGNGLYTLKNGHLKAWETEISQQLMEHKLYCGSAVDKLYLFGTIKNGLYIVDQNGQINQHLNRSNGLQNSTILSLFLDHQKNIWLGLDNGIDFIRASLPISYINYNNNISTSYSSITYKDRLYVGTNQGLYTKKVADLNNYSDIKYDLIDGTDGQVWNLTVHDGKLFCGHTNGAYIIEGTNAKKITEVRGIWNFQKIPGREDLLISGTYDGLITFSKGKDGSWKFRRSVKGLDISSQKLIVNEDLTFWMSHGYLGIYQFKLNEDLDSVVSLKEFKGSQNLPETLPYMLHELKGEIFLSTVEGIYKYNEAEELFYKPENLNHFFSDLQLIYLIKEDARGNIWYSSENGMGVYRLLEDGTFKKISTPFLDLRTELISPFDNIHVQNPENVFIGTQTGLVHYDHTINKNYFSETSAYINRVRISSKVSDSLWHCSGNAQMDKRLLKAEFSVPYSFNHISFEFNSPDLENAKHLEYSYRLNNFDEEWSEWNPASIKEYTNLHEASYIFEVRARNTYNNISNVAQFHFMVKPPLYRSKYALILYLLIGIVIVIAIVFSLFKRMEKIRSQEKIKHLSAFQKKEERLQEQKVAAEKEVIQLRNEKLRADMKHKNKELATSTFHIIQKNKFLNSLKQELSKLSYSAKSEQVEIELKKISRKIDKDIQNEKNWEVFDRYFDDVHQEFLGRLKELHPELTPNELRLSAYLRMNISTKEIAPLMNISVRGAEISRYRLRKKLKLDRHDNLTEYIMQV